MADPIDIEAAQPMSTEEALQAEVGRLTALAEQQAGKGVADER